MNIPLLVKKAVQEIDKENQIAFGATDVSDFKPDLMEFLNGLVNDPTEESVTCTPERAIHCAIKVFESLESVEHHTKKINEWTKAIINN